MYLKMAVDVKEQDKINCITDKDKLQIVGMAKNSSYNVSPIQNNYDTEVDFEYVPVNEDCSDDDTTENENTDIDEPPCSVKLVFDAYVKYLTSFRGGNKLQIPALQNKYQVETMLACVCPDSSSLDNLFSIELLHDKWLSWANEAGRGKNGTGHKPGTLRSYLGSLGSFIKFIITESTIPYIKTLKIPCSIDVQTMKVVQEGILNWSRSLRDECDDRQWEVLVEDLNTIIEPEEMMKVFNSEASICARQFLNRRNSSRNLGQVEYVLVRDYISTRC